jgi:hypothetical protein
MNIRMPAPGCLVVKLIPFNFRLEADCLTGRRELGSFFKCLLSGPEVNRVERSLTVCGRDEYELVGLRPIVIDKGF